MFKAFRVHNVFFHFLFLMQGCKIYFRCWFLIWQSTAWNVMWPSYLSVSNKWPNLTLMIKYNRALEASWQLRSVENLNLLQQLLPLHHLLILSHCVLCLVRSIDAFEQNRFENDCWALNFRLWPDIIEKP